MKNNVFKVLIVGFFIIIVGLAVIASDIIVKQGNLNVNDLTANGKVRIGSSAPTVGSYSLAFNRYSTIWGADNNEYYLGHNVYYSNGWKYRESDAGTGATLINIGGGTFNVRTVGDGAKDGAITWNQGLIVDNMGNVGIGTQTPRAKLHVTGNLKVTNTNGGGAGNGVGQLCIDSTGLICKCGTCT